MSGLMSPPGNQNLWSVLNAKRKLSAEPLAHDPTATWARLKCRSAAVSCCTKVCYPFGRTQGGIGSEAARVHHPTRRRGGGVATRGARAAVGKDDPDYRLPRGGLAFELQFSWFAAFNRRLREVGWIDGRTVAIVPRWAEGRNERFAEIAAEFVALTVNVIVTGGGAVLALMQATSTIPIVFSLANDPVASGYVRSLARPGATSPASQANRRTLLESAWSL